MGDLSYFDNLLRGIAKGEKRTEGQWNRLVQETLRELDSLINKEGTVYDSSVMLSFEEYQTKLSKLAKEKIGTIIQTPA